jgi:hypothetical protein
MFKKQILSAIILASTLLVLSPIVLLILVSSHADFLPEQSKEMQIFDSTPQRLAHAVWVLLVALTYAFILATPKRR